MSRPSLIRSDRMPVPTRRPRTSSQRHGNGIAGCSWIRPSGRFLRPAPNAATSTAGPKSWPMPWTAGQRVRRRGSFWVVAEGRWSTTRAGREPGHSLVGVISGHEISPSSSGYGPRCTGPGHGDGGAAARRCRCVPEGRDLLRVLERCGQAEAAPRFVAASRRATAASSAGSEDAGARGGPCSRRGRPRDAWRRPARSGAALLVVDPERGAEAILEVNSPTRARLRPACRRRQAGPHRPGPPR